MERMDGTATALSRTSATAADDSKSTSNRREDDLVRAQSHAVMTQEALLCPKDCSAGRIADIRRTHPSVAMVIHEHRPLLL